MAIEREDADVRIGDDDIAVVDDVVDAIDDEVEVDDVGVVGFVDEEEAVVGVVVCSRDGEILVDFEEVDVAVVAGEITRSARRDDDVARAGEVDVAIVCAVTLYRLSARDTIGGGPDTAGAAVIVVVVAVVDVVVDDVFTEDATEEVADDVDVDVGDATLLPTVVLREELVVTMVGADGGDLRSTLTTSVLTEARIGVSPSCCFVVDVLLVDAAVSTALVDALEVDTLDDEPA